MNTVALGISRPGRRENNEDAVYPVPGSAETPVEGLFLVCDGVGGADNGEVASHITVSGMVRYYANSGVIGHLSPTQGVRHAIEEVERALDDHRARYTGATRMATTLAMLRMTDNVAIVAHVGDSRVYHVRNGEVLFKTKDHSLVQELVEAGFITEKEALTHPKRNVITRAVSGRAQPAMADVSIIADIQKGDVFFLCTDGVLESLTDDMVGAMFAHRRMQTDGLSSTLIDIDLACTQHSNDNYSAIIVAIKEANEGVPAPAETVHHTSFRLREQMLVALLVILVVIDIYLLLT